VLICLREFIYKSKERVCLALKVRQSNFETLRILSMLMIVLLHFGTYGISKYISIAELSAINQFFYHFIKILSIVGVNIYVFISGYFLCKSEFKWKSAIRIIRETFIFSMLIYISLTVFQFTQFSISNVIDFAFPIFLSNYWFITVYMLLYLLSPYINILMKNLSKHHHLRLILLLFMVNCIWQVINPINSFGVNSGYSIIHFIFIYIIAGYIRNYGFFKFNLQKYFYLSIYLTLAAALAFFERSTLELPFKLLTYNSPFIVIMSYTLFMYFKELSFSSKFINVISGHVLGVYLIHEHPMIRYRLWDNIMNWIDGSDSLLIVSYLLYAVCVFIVCLVASYGINTVIQFTLNKSDIYFKKKKTVIEIDQMKESS
jgi:surface polysaccharide O-acyltransferase-like enzyme